LVNFVGNDFRANQNVVIEANLAIIFSDEGRRASANCSCLRAHKKTCAF